jgi:hypothetical protein
MEGSTPVYQSLMGWQEPIGVHGLIGCTSLILTSDQGVYMTHWWQTRGFSLTRPEDGNLLETLYDHKGEFQEQVLDALKYCRRNGSRIYHTSPTQHSNMANVRG